MMMNDEMVALNEADETKAVESATPHDAPAATEEVAAVADQPAAEAPAPEAPAMTEVAPEPVLEAAPAPAPEPAASDEPPADDLDLFEAEMAKLGQQEARSKETGQNTRRLQKNDRVEATVIQVEKDRAFVDLGTKSEGVVPLSELTDDNVSHAGEVVKVGDRIVVIVLKTDGGDGNPVVSKKRADFDEAWHRVVRAFQSQEVLNAQVVDRVKGGLLVDVGVRGFVPATHVGSGKLRNIEKFVGETLQLKVIEIDRERKKVVLSNKSAEEEEREKVKESIFTTVAPGDKLEGTVRRLSDYGAFVDLGGIDGLLHISEMSWMRINHPKEVLKEGQEVTVMVLKLDKSIGKISLGLRQVLPDPWNLIKENYKIGQKINATINRMVQSGAFIRLPEGAEAFLPVSEISHRRVNKPSDVLTENQEVEATIIDLRPDERRMVLSLKSGAMPDQQQIGYGYGAPAADAYSDRGRPGTDRGGDRKKGGPKKKGGGGGDDGSSTRGGSMGLGGATIGERLGMLKGLKAHFRSEDPEAETPEAVVEAPVEAPVENVEEPKAEE